MLQQACEKAWLQACEKNREKMQPYATQLPTPPGPAASATPVTDDGQPPANRPPPPTDDTPAASATDDNEPIPWEDVPAELRNWRSWRFGKRRQELHLHAPDALGYQVPAYELFMYTWGFVPSETYHQALEQCYVMTFEDTRAEARGWGEREWQPKDTRRSPREQLLHELSRNGESRTYWGTAKRNRKRNKKTTDAPRSAPSPQPAAAEPPAPLSPAPRVVPSPPPPTSTPTPTPTSTSALMPSMSPKGEPAARPKSNRRRRSRKSKAQTPQPPFPSTTTSISTRFAAATVGT